MKIEKMCSILNEAFFPEEEEKNLPPPVVDNDYIGSMIFHEWLTQYQSIWSGKFNHVAVNMVEIAMSNVIEGRY